MQKPFLKSLNRVSYNNSRKASYCFKRSLSVLKISSKSLRLFFSINQNRTILERILLRRISEVVNPFFMKFVQFLSLGNSSEQAAYSSFCSCSDNCLTKFLLACEFVSMSSKVFLQSDAEYLNMLSKEVGW